MNAFELIDQLESAPRPAPKLKFVKFADCKVETSQVALVQGLLGQASMSVMVGEPGSGKTFTALDLAMHVSAGADWLGRKVKQGAVVYIAAEAGASIGARIQALKIGHPEIASTSLPFVVVPCAVDLFSEKSDLEDLISLMREYEAEEKIVLIVVDTLNRAMVGGDENSSVDMGSFIKSMERMREAMNAHVLIVHHCGKDATKGARGHSSLKAAVDTELTVTPGQIRASKQRDLPIGTPIGFRLEPIQVAVSDDGEPVTSCVVRPSAVEPPRAKISEGSLQALEALRSITSVQKPQAEATRWLQTFGDRYYAGSPKSTRSMAFKRASTDLQAKNLVIVEDGFAWISANAVHTSSQRVHM